MSCSLQLRVMDADQDEKNIYIVTSFIARSSGSKKKYRVYRSDDKDVHLGEGPFISDISRIIEDEFYGHDRHKVHFQYMDLFDSALHTKDEQRKAEIHKKMSELEKYFVGRKEGLDFPTLVTIPTPIVTNGSTESPVSAKDLEAIMDRLRELPRSL